jgi:NADH oxidase (H2O2-forming)
LPFVVGGQIKSFEDLVVYSSRFYKMMRFNLLLNTFVTNINLENKNIEIENKDGSKEKLNFDSLILTTGGYPFKPPISGLEKENVFEMHTLADGKKVFESMNRAKSAVIIGTGLAGLETAEAFMHKGIKTTIIEMFPSVLPGKLDIDIAREVQRGFEKHGVSFILGKSADAICGDDTVKSVCAGDSDIPADIVINAAGVRPNAELAKKAGLEIGRTGAIKTNIRMQTSFKGVYAAGDCAETVYLLTGHPICPRLGSTAVRQGKVAGINSAGGYSIYPGALGSWISRMLDFEVGAVGLTEYWAKKNGLDVAVGKVKSSTRAPYFPGGQMLKVKLIADKETKRIVGGQIFGGEDVTQRINAISLSIQSSMTVMDLAKADTCYAPSVCETWEPFVLAAEIILKKLKS